MEIQRNRRGSRGRLTLLTCNTLLLLTLLVEPASAVDGVLEINQARADAGGVSPGDTAGFPVTLSESGHYRLTGNLTVPDVDTTAVEITAADVTLDLNGFAILGPRVTGSGLGRGVTSSAGNTSVVNGTVRGLGGYGVFLGDHGRVFSVRALGNGIHGIQTQDIGVIRDSVAVGNGFDGLQCRNGCTLSDNAAGENGRYGLHCGEGCVLHRNASRDNANHGFEVSINSTVVHNSAHSNGGAGFRVSNGSVLIGNTAWANTGTSLDLNPAVGYRENVVNSITGGVALGANLCFQTVCP